MNSRNMTGVGVVKLPAGVMDGMYGPTQHSITKSRVSFAHVTSLGRSSVSTTVESVVGVGMCTERTNGRTGDHFCYGGLGKGEVVIYGREPGMSFAV